MAPKGPDWDQLTQDDDAAINKLLSGSQTGADVPGLDLDHSVPISQEGKADDAFNFEDISDDELPDEEDATGPTPTEMPGLTDDTGTSNETDDLFGGEPSSPNDVAVGSSPPPDDDPSSAPDFEANFPNTLASNQDPDIPEAPESVVELVHQKFPKFERGVILNFNEQLAPQPIYRVEKKASSQHPPKPLVPTNLTLALEPDQKNLFKIPAPANGTRRQRINDAVAKGFTSCLEPEVAEVDDGNIFGTAVDEDISELVGGFSLRDIEIVCEDWDELLDPPTPPTELQPAVQIVEEGEDEWDREFLQPAPKRRKIVVDSGLPTISRFTAPSFDTFEDATARSAKRVYLDLGDPYLLLDEMETERPSKRQKIDQEQEQMANDGLFRHSQHRFNYSNDNIYAQVPESHRTTVRAQYNSIKVEHSAPSIKLLWPYYRITPRGPEPHDYHRPQLQTGRGIGFSVKMAKANKVPKEKRKARRVQDQFAASKDLSLNDRSTAVLFEYCEEIPTALSYFGMGNKIINYYRHRSKDEEDRPPKFDLGEPQFLGENDKSPFSIFGSVDPGEIIPTLHNPMFHAPIFKQTARPTDFLFGRTTTGMEGTHYYLRKIDHLYVVGQNFPLAEVPGPHSRKVTTLSKNRLKMVAYRLIHKKGHVSLSDITEHVKDSNDAQNRQKLKEFLFYDKDSRSWGLNANEHLMDLGTINTMIKPEEVCLLDAMQVGQNELEQNGYQLNENGAADDDDEENEKDDHANTMVPWKTTKNFIDACSGKAMLQLHGAGDPTGRGLGFSFIKTSMKGGYMDAISGPAATSADAIERERKANGGHSYNVKKQEALYNEAIRRIWNLQKENLQDDTAHDDEDVQLQEDEDDRFNFKDPAATPAHMDDGMSQMSRPSMSNASKGKKLVIKRKFRDSKGEIITKIEVVHDPGVISQYQKHRAKIDIASIDPYNIKPTGNQDYDRVLMQAVDTEEARLNRNKERRHAREKQKAAARSVVDDSLGPDSPAQSIEKGTSRKCANCGQKGHIKTNKKLCPMLNGTYKADKNMEEGAFGVYQ